MPTFVTACANCGELEAVRRMREGKAYMPCPQCERPRPQVLFPPHVQEDRLAVWKGPLGNGYSTALGMPMPSSRSERDRLARERGVEFCSLSELRADSKEAADALDYKAHVDSGGARDEKPRPDTSHVWKEKPPSL